MNISPELLNGLIGKITSDPKIQSLLKDTLVPLISENGEVFSILIDDTMYEITRALNNSSPAARAFFLSKLTREEREKIMQVDIETLQKQDIAQDKLNQFYSSIGETLASVLVKLILF